MNKQKCAMFTDDNVPVNFTFVDYSYPEQALNDYTKAALEAINEQIADVNHIPNPPSVILRTGILNVVLYAQPVRDFVFLEIHTQDGSVNRVDVTVDTEHNIELLHQQTADFYQGSGKIN